RAAAARHRPRRVPPRARPAAAAGSPRRRPDRSDRQRRRPCPRSRPPPPRRVTPPHHDRKAIVIALHEGRTTSDLSGPWSYALDPDGVGEDRGYPAADFDAAEWKTLELPTNWYLTEIGDYFGTVWFRRTFRVPEEFAGQRVYLRVRKSVV